MSGGILNDDGLPRSAEVARIACRVSVIRWFAEERRDHHGPERVARALLRHEALLDGCRSAPPAGTAETPPFRMVASTARVLRGAEGRTALRSGAIDLARPRWIGAMQRAMDLAAAALAAHPERVEDHPLFERTGRALLVRPAILPIEEAVLWRRLQGPRFKALPDAIVRALVDRVLWEVGAALTWELVGDLIGGNPFTPLIEVYEEGLYPLELTATEVTLWRPKLG